MNPNIPMLLPPPLVLPQAQADPEHPLMGDPINYDDLVPGEEYIHRYEFIGHHGIAPDYRFIRFISKTPTEFTYEEFPPIRFNVNERGDPLTPYSIPQAPTIAPRQRIFTHPYNPQRDSFFLISPVKRGRFFVGPQIKRKLKTNLRRKHLNMLLDQLGFSTNVGTGPADIIRKFVNLQPPKGAKGPAELRSRKVTNKRLLGGKRRKTRRNA
jgi:hypothetical protein